MKLLKIIQIQLINEKDKINETVEKFVEAMNFVSCFARKTDIYSKNKLQERIYYEIREKFGLKSQMTVNSIRNVATQYTGKHKSNRFLKDKKGNPKPVEFKAKSMRLNYPRDYRFKRNSTLSINSLYGRLMVRYKIGEYQKKMLDSKDYIIKSSMITIRKDGIIFLNVTIEKEIHETTLLMKDGVVGVDLGINFVAVTTDTNYKTDFYGGGKVKYKRWLYAKHRKEAQSKGTRSSKRFLQRIRRRETRFVTDANHCIAKTIVQKAKERFTSPIIAMEDLKGIRQQEYIGKDHRVRLSKWTFYQLQQFIEYKALEQGIPVIYIDPHYTSQGCPKCGHTERANRNHKLHLFKCKKCSYTSNDDRSASINIRDRAVVPRYIRGTRGLLSIPLM